MKSIASTGFALLLLLCSDYAQAQFSQPPPNRPPPTCRITQNSGPDDLKSDCKSMARYAPIDLRVSCRPSDGEVTCIAFTRWFDGVQWWTVNPSTLIYDWAFTVDGQEYYDSIDYNSTDFSCGATRHGYVRVTAAGTTTMITYQCR